MPHDVIGQSTKCLTRFTKYTSPIVCKRIGGVNIYMFYQDTVGSDETSRYTLPSHPYGILYELRRNVLERTILNRQLKTKLKIKDP